MRMFNFEGFDVLEAGNGGDMRDILAKNQVDLVLLDLVLPGEDGLTLAREIRKTGDIPIIMLTGRDEPIDKVIGLEIGADDYVTKPFFQRELTARVKTVLRRHVKKPGANAEPEGRVLRFSGWTLDMDGQFVKSENDEIVSLTAYEFQVLAALAQNSGRVLGREQILDLVAARNWDPYDRSIDVLIGKIRRKLKDDPRKPTIIKTVRNAGYLFMAKTE
ncbi:MAG: response regulator transcription factor [Rhodospirillales bacterium]|nr:response regulator transcription factor [Alphaproteobacteria bacterium]MBL6948013.1 response regulator transcription factor [Rhodospirillales bacterium]